MSWHWLRFRRTRRKVLALMVLGGLGLVVYPHPADGTVEEQRARLPPPQECTDPVEGVWMALKYTEGWHEWYEFSLQIHRVDPDKPDLKGEITSHFWRGDKKDEKPPVCRPGSGQFELVVKMPATGTLEATPKGDRVVFGSTSFTIDKVICGGNFGRYNPDNFSGTIDPALQEFQSVNNDGGKSINDPHVFRRVKCFEQPRKDPKLNVKPPAFAPVPKKATGGCGL